MAQRSTTTFHGPDNLYVQVGDVRADDDPIVKKYPHFFVDADTLTERVETATARPGVKRAAK